MPTILLIRHAQASFGSGDYDVLSERGRRQVEILHAALEAQGVGGEKLLSGSLRRQRDTAEPWLGSGRELDIDQRWNEYDSTDVLRAHGDDSASLEHSGGDSWPGLTSQQFQVILDRALHEWVAAGAAGTALETWSSFRGRALAALEALGGGLASGETAIAFTSGGVIAAVCVALLGLPDTAFVQFNRVAINCAVTKLVSGRSGTTLVSFNEHAHLGSGDLVTYR
jgi:broad specificity phosphatase PhoE